MSEVIREEYRVSLMLTRNPWKISIEGDENNDKYPEWVYEAIKKMSYDLYLQSVDWKEKRKQAINRANGRCQLCNSDRFLHVHHRTYERFGDEDLDDLTVLCGRCHKLYHQQFSE